jgi:hypothetical protein
VRTVLSIALVALAGACGDDKPAVPSGPDAVVAAWTKAGLTVSAMTPADGTVLGGGNCRAGTVGGLDVTLCSYTDAHAADSAQAAGLASVGQATGVSLAEGTQLLVIADRRNTDPSGRTIDQLTKIFRGR